jgi:IS30 family transposase
MNTGGWSRPGLAAGRSQRRIATALGRPHSTISRELARNGGRDAYRVRNADTTASSDARLAVPLVATREHVA